MIYRHGANHDPNSPALSNAIDYSAVKVGGAAKDTDWFGLWNWRATGNMLGNDGLGNCCECADIVLTEGFRAALGLPVSKTDDLTALAKNRYAQIAGWDGSPQTDVGSDPAQDCFAWAAAPIVAGDRTWEVRWATVRPVDVLSALRRGPMQLTLGLTAEDEDDPDLWGDEPAGPFAVFHRVVAGAARGSLLMCRTYGRDVLVSSTRVVAADLLLPVDMPAELRTAGIDWSQVA